MRKTNISSTTQGNNERQLLNPLTSFRFFAALLVFITHSHLFPGLNDRYEFGYIGVSFFFVLSGFVLTYAYFDKLMAGNRSHIKSFYIARIAKIYPVHILTFLISLPLVFMVFSQAHPIHTTLAFLQQTFMNLGLFQAYSSSSDTNFSFNGVAWSISVEMFFYALMPFIALAIARVYHQLTARRLLAAIGITWLIISFILLSHPVVSNAWGYYILPLTRLPDFMVGIFLCLLYRQLPARTTSVAKSTAFEFGSLALLTGAIMATAFLPDSMRFGVTLIPFWALIIFIFARQHGLLSRVMSVRPLVFLGEISFSFYMIHLLVIRYVRTFVPVDHPALVSLAIALPASAALFLLYEEPMRKRAKAYLQQRVHWPRPLLGGNRPELEQPSLPISVATD